MNDEPVECEKFTYLNYVGKCDQQDPINYEKVRVETNKDTFLKKVISEVQNNNLFNLKDPIYEPFHRRAAEVSVEKGILMWGYRVVIPVNLRSELLQQVHQSHLVIVKTKSICRSFFWWPNIDRDVEQLVKSCEACLSALPSPPKAPVISWESTEEPWSRLHIDYAGPFKDQYFFVIIDSHSKWIKVFPSKTMSADFAVTKLRELFARFGLPHEVVSDNGTKFTSRLYELSKKGG